MSDISEISVFTAKASRPQSVIFKSRTDSKSERLRDDLERLIRLPQGWDGYSAKPVSFRNAEYAGQLVAHICTDDTPYPSIVPGYRGDLQLEWHTIEHDIEIHIVAPMKASLWTNDHTICPDGEALMVDIDLGAALRAVRRMTEALNAADATAA